jgi:hypothetical protein
MFFRIAQKKVKALTNNATHKTLKTTYVTLQPKIKRQSLKVLPNKPYILYREPKCHIMVVILITMQKDINKHGRKTEFVCLTI